MRCKKNQYKGKEEEKEERRRGEEKKMKIGLEIGVRNRGQK